MFSVRISVSITPGATALTRIPSGAHSIARSRVIAAIPPLAALYEARFPAPRMAAIDETLTIAPPCRARSG